jgi:hypothetical protein
MSFTNITGFCVLAELQYGSNGEVSGASECDAGKSADSESSGRRKWAADTSGGVDSGWVPIQLVVNADSINSPVAWAIDGADPDPIAYTGASFGEILYFKLRAGVRNAGRRMSFRNVSVSFYINGSDSTAAEYGQISNPPVASTVGEVDPVDAENIVDVGPENSGYRKATLSAEVRLESEDVPDATDIFGQLFVFTSSCQ